MPLSTKALLLGSALTGLMAGSSAPLAAHSSRLGTTVEPGSATVQDTGGDRSADSGKRATKSKQEKHACKGQNSCKGKGGCGATKGKNDCKGKGGCRTDGKPMDKKAG